MTITRARSIRVNFSAPYLQSGMSGLFRRTSCDPSGLVASTIMNQSKRVGAVKNTTGELFVKRNFTRSTNTYFSTAAQAVKALKAGKIDMFVHDAPMIWWLFAQDEQEFIAFSDVLNTEPIAWAVRKSDSELLNQVNAALLKWAKDGSRKKIVENWISLAR
jgi:polar amino acid transport system substrate-binding protein